MFAVHKKGRLAERLGRALQKLVRRFESAIDLHKKVPVYWRGLFIYTRGMPNSKATRSLLHHPLQRLWPAMYRHI
jgi:hypothetical protein